MPSKHEHELAQSDGSRALPSTHSRHIHHHHHHHHAVAGKFCTSPHHSFSIRQGMRDICIWLSERPAADARLPTMEHGQFVLEARAAVAAWRQVKLALQGSLGCSILSLLHKKAAALNLSWHTTQSSWPCLVNHVAAVRCAGAAAVPGHDHPAVSEHDQPAARRRRGR